MAAIAPDFTKSWYSNYADWVDIAAPGGTYTSGGKYATECAVYSDHYEQQIRLPAGNVDGLPACIGDSRANRFEIRRSRFHPRSGMGASDQTHQGDGLYNPSYLNKLGSGLADAYMGPGRRPGNSPGESTPARMQPDSRGYGRYLARIGR